MKSLRAKNISIHSLRLGPLWRRPVAGLMLGVSLLFCQMAVAAEFTVTANFQFTVSNDRSSAPDLHWKDTISVSGNGVTRYEVDDLTDTDAFTSTDDRDPKFTASRSVSGGGSYSVSLPTPWGCSSTWTYVENPAAGGPYTLAGGNLTVGLPDSPIPTQCGVSVYFPFITTVFDNNGCSLDDPRLWDWASHFFDVINQFDFTPDIPNKRESWSFNKTQTLNTNISALNLTASGSCTVTVQLVPTAPQWEAVISFLSGPGLPDYETWLPIGGTDEDHPGTNLMALVEIRPAAGNTNSPPKASYTISLEDVSSEPGVCLNSPPKDKAKSSKDLQIYQLELGNLKVSEDGQSATSKQNATSVGLIIDCYDFGAYGKLKATAQTEDGQTLVAYLDGHPDQTLVPIPKDDNGNHVADAWEKDKGVYDRNLAADWDEVDYPKDHKCAGDGISLYKRYRGFKFQGLYERLTPTNKFVFVYDPDDLVKDLEQNQDAKINCFRVVSGCRVRYVEDEEWTGQGMAGAKKRIVNFNSSGFGHAVDQHGITVTQNLEETPVVPPDWDKMWQTHNNGVSWSATDSLQDTLGITWPDYTTSGFDCPKNTFLITIYPPRNTTDIRDWVGYHTWALPAYANYAHLPPADQAAMVAAVAAAADAFISDVANYEDYQQRYYQNLSMTTTHEMGHGLGVKHHDPTDAGSHQCVMRYFGLDCPRNANDRFELAARAPWPNIYCRSADHTANARGCWYQIKITDK